MKIATIISYLLHPIFAPLIIFSYTIHYIPEVSVVFSSFAGIIQVSIIIFTIILPILVIKFLMSITKDYLFSKNSDYKNEIIRYFYFLYFLIFFYFLSSFFIDIISQKLYMMNSVIFVICFILLFLLMISALLFFFDIMFLNNKHLFLKFIKIICFPFSKDIKLIESMQMHTKEERIYPLFWSLIIIVFGYQIIEEVLQASLLLKSIYISLIVTLLFSFMITLRWKISLHMVGIGSITGVIMSLNYLYGGAFYLSLILLLLSGLLAYARISLNRHTHLQVYVGFLFSICINVFLILNYNSIISTTSIFLSSIASIL